MVVGYGCVLCHCRFTLGGQGDGPLQFDFGKGDVGWLCFLQRAPGVHHLLVSEGANHRIQEIDVLGRRHVAFLFADLLSNPRGVSAAADLIAVAEDMYTDRRVSIFDAATGECVSLLSVLMHVSFVAFAAYP